MSSVYMYIGKATACDLFRAGVAQLAEHVLGKDGVTGSIPVSSFFKDGCSRLLTAILSYARDNHIRVHGLQKQELHHDQE